MKRLDEPKPCCHNTAATDRNAMWCGECGQPLARCMAHAECGGLVGADGRCEICVNPRLIIETGATMYAPVGGSVAVPISLMNDSVRERPVFITGLWSREQGEWRAERLGWDELRQKERRPASVTVRNIDRPGLHQIQIMLAVATRFKQREEQFAFSTSVYLTVEDESSSSGPTIQITNENEANGSIIQVHANTYDGEGGEKRLIDALAMKLDRVEKDERELGMRAMENGLQIRRDACIHFSGFPQEDHGTTGNPIMTEDGMLAFGRERSRQTGGASDVRILVSDAQGKLDHETSLTISRRHMDLFIENDRLVVRARGMNGLSVSGKVLDTGERYILDDGDRIEPLARQPAMLGIIVTFTREHGRVTAVRLTRDPVLEKAL